jgi:hypothetical protein
MGARVRATTAVRNNGLTDIVERLKSFPSSFAEEGKDFSIHITPAAFSQGQPRSADADRSTPLRMPRSQAGAARTIRGD